MAIFSPNQLFATNCEAAPLQLWINTDRSYQWFLERRSMAITGLRSIELGMLEWSLNSYLANAAGITPDGSGPFISLKTQGVSNFALQFSSKKGNKYLIRLKSAPDTGQIDRILSAYHKEKWVMSLLEGLVPVPRIPDGGIGTLPPLSGGRQFAFIMQELMPYQNGYDEQCPKKRKHLLYQIGHVARVINSTSVSGFGSTYSKGDSRFRFSSFSDWTASIMAELALDEVLTWADISTQELKKILRFIEPVLATDEAPSLFHGDFANNWGNILVDNRGNLKAVIDWELCGGGPATIIELATMLYVYIRNGTATELFEKEFGIFLNGYGVSQEEYADEYADSVHRYIGFIALQKINNYMQMDRQGKLTAPWQRAFADRAVEALRLIGQRSRAYL